MRKSTRPRLYIVVVSAQKENFTGKIVSSGAISWLITPNEPMTDRECMEKVKEKALSDAVETVFPAVDGYSYHKVGIAEIPDKTIFDYMDHWAKGELANEQHKST